MSQIEALVRTALGDIELEVEVEDMGNGWKRVIMTYKGPIGLVYKFILSQNNKELFVNALSK